jgi:hypothetical protein
MPIPTSETALTQLFEELGANAPAQWAHSQVHEGIPQLLRFLFLKSAWERIPAEGDTHWIEAEIQNSHAHPNEPYSGLGRSLARCRAKGVSDEDLNEMARCLKVEMLFAVSYLIDGPAELPESLEDVSWGLFQVDEDGHPMSNQIAGLHESVLELDPTRREMRPRIDG